MNGNEDKIFTFLSLTNEFEIFLILVHKKLNLIFQKIL